MSNQSQVSVRSRKLRKSRVSLRSSLSLQQSDEEDQCAKPVSGLSRFQRSLRRLWQTPLTDDIPEDDQERIFKTTIKELVIYLVFVTLLCIVGFCMLDPYMYYFTKVLKGLFIDSNDSEFEKVTRHDDFFKYATGTLLDGLYWEQYYDGKDVADDEINYIYFENKLLGLPRIRQVRVKNNSCKVPLELKNTITTCITGYSLDQEDTESFGLENGTAWEYSTAEELSGLGAKGRFTTYGGGAFYELLGPDKFGSKKKIDKLKENRWLDRQTRAVIIDITVYNANINMFCIMTFMFEYPPTGAAVPFYQFNTLKLLRYVTGLDHFVMFCEGLLFIFLIYYIVEEAIEMKNHRLDYFKHFWNYMDCCIIMLVFGTLMFNLYRTFNVSTKLKKVLDGYDSRYGNFEELSAQQQFYNDIVAVTLFISWLKVFKYISFNQTLLELQNTLSTCASDMAAFALMFFLVFLAYAQWGYLIFGYMVADFRTYFDSVFALFRVILGDFDFLALEEANRTVGPVFFISYIFVIFFIMLNMFLAILFDTYAEVKEEMGEEDEDKFGVGDLFAEGMDKLTKKLLSRKKNVKDVKQMLADGDENITYDEWKDELTSRGYKLDVIDDLFMKYDLTGDGVLDLNDKERFKNDLEVQEREIMEEIIEAKRAKKEAEMGSRFSVTSSKSGNDEDEGDEDDEEETDPVVTGEHLDDLAERVEKAESEVGDILKKIDAALIKLEAMDKTVLPGREAMGKILEKLYKAPEERNFSASSKRSNDRKISTKSNFSTSRSKSKFSISSEAEGSTMSLKEDNDEED